MKTSRQAGFTLVELLVVIAIIGILVSLLLPAVQSAREAARRIQCSSQLRQVALALHNYENTHKVLPPCGIVDNNLPDFSPRSGNQFSWLVLILPQLEQQNLHDRFDFTQTAFNQPQEPQATPLALLRCPSDGRRGTYFVDSALSAGKKFAKGNYAAFVSPFHTDWQRPWQGAVPYFGQTLAEVKDGTSNTLALSEVRTRSHEQDHRGAWVLPWTGSTLLAFDMHDEDFAGTYTHHPGSIGWTQPPNNRGPNTDMLYECPDSAGAQLEGMPCSKYEPGTPFEYLSAAPRSQHPGGVVVAYLDGHVSFLSESVDEILLAYAICVNDGVAVQIPQ